jgi:hypothetical protein
MEEEKKGKYEEENAEKTQKKMFRQRNRTQWNTGSSLLYE